MGDEENEPQYQVLYIDQPNEEPEAWIKRAGRARVSYVDGSSYEGDFNAAQQKHGQGTYTWSYEAIREVEGVPEWNEPDEGEEEAPKPFMRYSGGYQYGLKHGLGLLEYPNGDTYRGQFAFDKRHGAGTYKYVADGTGNIYSGEWRNGLRHGAGAFVFGADGSQLVGEWVDGNIVSGKWLLRDGSVYCGDFKKNKPNGKGSFVFPNGSMISGKYGIPLNEDGEEPEDDEDEDGAIGATHWTTSELVEANASAAELNRASLPQRPFVPTLAKRIVPEIAEGARYTPFPIRYEGGSRAETGNNGLSIAEVVEAGAIVISNTDLRPARIEGDEEGADGEDGSPEDEEELEEEDEEALARRLTANLRGITLTHVAPNNGGAFSVTLPELHVARGERVRILFGDCASNPRLADPVVQPTLDEDGNPIEDEEPAEPVPTKDLLGSTENIFANGVGTITLTFTDVHGDEQVLWRRSVAADASDAPAEGEGGEDAAPAAAAAAADAAAAGSVTVSGLNYIRGPDPLPEPEPEAEEGDDDDDE
eukprot:INCI2983.1.p1 GENE.INCI2983.1~~INCI2983.1.p1  ORF type:complete len:534 (+),score=115.55 INCI2983.1:139-1740(+)